MESRACNAFRKENTSAHSEQQNGLKHLDIRDNKGNDMRNYLALYEMPRSQWGNTTEPENGVPDVLFKGLGAYEKLKNQNRTFI